MSPAARVVIVLGALALSVAPALVPQARFAGHLLDSAAHADDGASDDAAGSESGSDGGATGDSDAGDSDSGGDESGGGSGSDHSTDTGSDSSGTGSSSGSGGGDSGGTSNAGGSGGAPSSGSGSASSSSGGSGSGGSGSGSDSATSGSAPGPGGGSGGSSETSGGGSNPGGAASGVTSGPGTASGGASPSPASPSGGDGAPSSPSAGSGAQSGSTATIASPDSDSDPLPSSAPPKSDYVEAPAAPRPENAAPSQPSSAAERPSQSLPEAIAGLLGLRPAEPAPALTATPATPTASAAETGTVTPAPVNPAAVAGTAAAEATPTTAAAPGAVPSLAELPAQPGAIPAPSLGQALSTLLGGGQRQPARTPETPAPLGVPAVAKAPAAVPPVTTASRSPTVQAPAQSLVARAARITPSSGSGPSHRQHELTALGMTPRARQVVGALGFRIISERRSRLLGNEIVAKLRTPRDQTAEAALRRLRAALPELVFDHSHLYRSTGDAGAGPVRYAANLVGLPATGACRVETRIGLIDTGVGRHEALAGTSITQRSFVARDASRNVTHGTAVASLLVGALPGGNPLTPGAALYSANVFAGEGTALRADALAIIEALDWMAAERVPVVNLSLMGPDNALLAKAVQAAAERGLILVAAAGNAGPDAPPAYPAAYPSVISVAAVDARARPYARNNRGSYVEIAAPGVDIWAADARGGVSFWTGTSFAVPFVTAAVARDVGLGRARNINDSRRLLAASARDLGAPGRDPIYGHGLVRLDGCEGQVMSARNR